MTSHCRQRGMTLVELMVAVAIVSILAAIAIPSYRQYVVRSQRADATSALLALATAQEKFYLQCNTYASALGDANSCADGEVAFADTSANGWYDLTIDAASDTDFTVSAAPHAGGPQAADSDCASFSVTGQGVRTATSTRCWQ
ncbi:MAG: prepilin-type N-terminal cleavage/methylation domain-containing protein [Gammaproteobacteria bacterium]|nr:prepilin-type N-terminal cleavage/methylation domain-containing protein [Gammaproteobacteria bacterium]